MPSGSGDREESELFDEQVNGGELVHAQQAQGGAQQRTMLNGAALVNSQPVSWTWEWTWTRAV